MPEDSKYENDANRLAAIVASSDDAIISKDLKSIITSWNKGAEKIFGYTSEEAIGKPISIIIPAGRQKEEDYILSKIRKGERVEHYETERVAKSGKVINIWLTVSPIKNRRNEVIGASKIARDITEQVAINQKLKEYNQKLKEINRLKDDFLGMASHELKTPLTIIKAHLQLAQSEKLDRQTAISIDKALQHADKLNQLIASLLDVSSIKKTKLTINEAFIDLNDLINNCVNNLRIVESAFTISKVGKQEPVWIKADKYRIEQVICNLLNNAVKYSGTNKTIEIQLDSGQNDVTVSVKDYGIGIPKSHLKAVFDRFYRLQDSKHVQSGLGLGLFIAKQIIKKHKGRIWAESEKGKGTTVFFKIPTT